VKNFVDTHVMPLVIGVCLLAAIVVGIDRNVTVEAVPSGPIQDALQAAWDTTVAQGTSADSLCAAYDEAGPDLLAQWIQDENPSGIPITGDDVAYFFDRKC
jgi:hypothetical protein